MFILASKPGVIEINLREGEIANITSPNYPDFYNNNEAILWRVTAPENFSVNVNFVDLDLETYFDFVYVGEGPTPLSYTELARLTGASLSPSLTSSGSQMWIKFSSDYSVTTSGFLAELSAVQAQGLFNAIPKYRRVAKSDCYLFCGRTASIVWLPSCDAPGYVHKNSFEKLLKAALKYSISDSVQVLLDNVS